MPAEGEADAEVILKDRDSVEDLASEEKKESWAPLEIVSVTTTLTADDLAAINEFLSRKPRKPETVEPFLTKAKKPGRRKESMKADKQALQQNSQQRQQTMMFTVEATEQELEQ